MDEIRIEELEVFANHGVFDFEKKDGQKFYLNAVLYLNAREAGRTDDLKKSVNYGEVCHRLTEWMQEVTFDLLETVAEYLAEKTLLAFPLIHHLDLEIQKPQAPIGLPFGSVSVKITRGWHRVYLSVGSNMGDREGHIRGALEKLRSDRTIRGVRCSELIVTSPYGGVEQEDFLNGAIAMDTMLAPGELLKRLHEIEAEAGRERKMHWGPRTLDLDILFYDRETYEDEDLIIPHIDLENREFVLRPLSELAPYFRHPISGKTVNQMLAELHTTGDR